MVYEITDVEQVQLYDRVKKFYKVKRVYFLVNNQEHTLEIPIEEFTRELAEERVKVKADEILGLIGKKK